jgi:DNA-binding MarR family transcriptional regulator
MTVDIVRELGHLVLGTRLKRLGERLQAHTQRILDTRELDIQAGQFPFLAAIDRLGPSTIGELADAVGVSQPAATRTLGQLSDAGVIEIRTPRADQRRRTCVLAKRGKELVEAGKREVWPVIDAAVREVCAGAKGPLLDQLAAIEDELAAMPLDQRAIRAARPTRKAAR